MPRGFFVTGTDTGVGKTVVSGALILALQREGLSVCGMKPVETGCERRGDELTPSDALFLRSISQCDEPLERVAPFRFEPPLAPMVAAELEGTDISLKRLRQEYEALSGRYDAVVVEGVGGLLVPLKRDYFVSHLARDMGLPLVVVSSPFLGTINHTLLTLEHALRMGLPVAGVVMNYHRPPEGTTVEQTNPKVIQALAPVPFLGVLPWLDRLEADALEQAAAEHLDMETLRKHL